MSDSTEVEYEMGYGADEFGNVLRGPFSGEQSGYLCATVERYHWRLTRAEGGFDLNIRVAEQPPRKLGLFNLPVLTVKFNFTDTGEAQREKFFHRFHQYFHKGGG